MIYDCFIFYNELDLLEIRLNELNDVVDKFVLVEAAFTFQGTPKPLYYNDNKDRFAAFNHKVIHIILHDIPPHNTAWELEAYQRNAIEQGIKNIKQDDWIIISDADEIPKAACIDQIARSMNNKIAVVLLLPFSYFIDYQSYLVKDLSYYKYLFLSTLQILKYKIKSLQYDWLFGTVMVQKKNFSTSQLIRESWKPWNIKANKSKLMFIKEAGWHFTYFGGIEKIIGKLNAFSHAELNTSEINNESHLTKVILSGKSISGDKQVHKVIAVLPSTHPKYLVANLNLYSNFLFRTFAQRANNTIK